MVKWLLDRLLVLGKWMSWKWDEQFRETLPLYLNFLPSVIRSERILRSFIAFFSTEAVKDKRTMWKVCAFCLNIRPGTPYTVEWRTLIADDMGKLKGMGVIPHSWIIGIGIWDNHSLHGNHTKNIPLNMLMERTWVTYHITTNSKVEL